MPVIAFCILNEAMFLFQRSSEKQIYHHPRFDIDAMIALGPSTVAALMRGYVVIMDTEGRVHAELGEWKLLRTPEIT